MFYGATSFNGNVSTWNTASVKDMVSSFGAYDGISLRPIFYYWWHDTDVMYDSCLFLRLLRLSGSHVSVGNKFQL